MTAPGGGFDYMAPLSPVRDDGCPARREALVIFSILVAGKTSRSAAGALTRLLSRLPAAPTPFAQLRAASDTRLRRCLTVARTGQYVQTEAALRAVQHLDLSRDQPEVAVWEAIPKIGPKTARMIATNLDPDVRAAILDVHLLRWLASRGHDVPDVTPQGPRYLRIEALYLAEADALGVHPRELDLAVWSQSQRRQETP